MRSGRIARTGEARRFGRYWFGCVKTGEQALASGLPRDTHEGDKIIGSRACNAARSHARSEEHTSELQSPYELVCRLLLAKQKETTTRQCARPCLLNNRCPCGDAACP